jgi:hypothetical protein
MLVIVTFASGLSATIACFSSATTAATLAAHDHFDALRASAQQ